MNKTLITTLMKKAKILSLPKTPTCMVLESYSPPGWMETTYYTVRTPDGYLMEEVRPEEIEFKKVK